MSTDWEKQYRKSRVWEESPYLVNADRGTKKCHLCELVKWTGEFPNASEFNDRKLPVCLKCYRKANGIGRKVISGFDGVARTCKKCGKALTLDNYAYRKDGNELHHTCRDCVGTYEFK